jgi:hypothetical protein
MFTNQHPFIRTRYNEMMTSGPRIYTTPQIWIDYYVTNPYDQAYPFFSNLSNRKIYITKNIY